MLILKCVADRRSSAQNQIKVIVTSKTKLLFEINRNTQTRTQERCYSLLFFATNDRKKMCIAFPKSTNQCVQCANFPSIVCTRSCFSNNSGFKAARKNLQEF